MDFHLDWIEMSVYLAARGVIPDKTPFRNEHFPKINQNQKDVDLLVAFEGDDTGETRTHMVLIEAKAYPDGGAASSPRPLSCPGS